MNTDLSKYEKMRDNGASPVDVGKQLRVDGIEGLDFYAVLSSVFGGLSFEDARKVIIDKESKKNLIDWKVPDLDEGLIEYIRKNLLDNPES